MLQSMAFLFPHDTADRADITFHSPAARSVLFCYFRINTLGDKEQMLRLFCTQLHGINQVKESGMICGYAKAEQQITNQSSLGHIGTA